MPDEDLSFPSPHALPDEDITISSISAEELGRDGIAGVTREVRQARRQLALILQAQRAGTLGNKGFMTWPHDGGIGLLPAGKTTFDLVQGIVDFPGDEEGGLAGRLDIAGIGFAQSIHVKLFLANASLRMYPPEELDVVPNRREMYVDAQTHTIRTVPTERVEVHTQLPGAAIFSFGESPDTPPVATSGVQLPVFKRGEMTTEDSLTGVIMRPVVQHPRTGDETIMTEERAQANALLKSRIVDTRFSKQPAWVVRNTGDNDADVNIEGAMEPVESAFSEDTVTQSGDTVAAGTTQVFEPGEYWKYQRFRAQSTSAGQPTTLTVDYGALGGIGI